jgi:mannose-6-phosphate isomerase-like protein (cupin superfamily)
MKTIRSKQKERKGLDLKRYQNVPQVMTTPKTIFCDIDGTLLPHTGDILTNLHNQIPLENVRDTLKQWDRMNHTIILTTGRKESTRKATEKKLLEAGIHYHQLVMNLPNGPRVVINDKKENGIHNMAYAINLVRNEGFNNVDLDSRYVTIPDRYMFTKVEKPWGYEELVECNDKYVVKKLFMKKGHKCSLQYHKLKRETIMVLTGELLISIGKDKETLETKTYGPGETVTILPYTVHRMEAKEDCLYSETSTNELWDVVRLEDSYGRVPETAK